jgi:hypothetical protein
MGAQTIEVAVVSRDELVELACLEDVYAAASKALSEAESSLKVARLALAEKVLGREAAKDLRLMDPEHLEQLMSARAQRGLWKSKRDAPPFVFLKTNSGRYPAWRAIYEAAHGEAAAEKIVAETPTYYSYRVDVAV